MGMCRACATGRTAASIVTSIAASCRWIGAVMWVKYPDSLVNELCASARVGTARLRARGLWRAQESRAFAHPTACPPKLQQRATADRLVSLYIASTAPACACPQRPEIVQFQ